jgi:hypothetical protein
MPRASAQPTDTDHQPDALAHFWLYAVAVERNVSPNMAHSNMRGAHDESRRHAVSDHRISVPEALLIIDVVPGNGGMFSLERPSGMRFLTRSRLFEDHESAWL